MKVPHQIIRLYLKTSKRYKKLISKLRGDMISEYERKTILRRIKKLLDILRGLHAQLKIAAATGTLVLMLNASPAQAQGPAQSTLGPFAKQDRLNNPLREPIFTGANPSITKVDLDGDGDLDAVVWEYNRDFPASGGYLRYFENRSAQGIPLYVELEGEQNPFSGIHATTYRLTPAFADIDEDGDMDLFLGQGGNYIDPMDPSASGIEYYRNDNGIFSKQSGVWDAATKGGNPLESISLGWEVNPVFADFDGDSDMDLVIGSVTGDYSVEKYIHYYENDGDGNYAAKDWSFDGFPTTYNHSLNLALTDLDGDGDLDLILGSYYDEYLSYFTQISPGNFEMQSGPWDPVARTGNPFNDFMVGLDPSPVFIDFNNDGLIDLFVADDEGAGKYSDHIIKYYENQGDNVFIKKDGFENPFGGVFVQGYASPVFIDLDGDQDLDVVIGNKHTDGTYDYAGNYLYTYSTLSYYENNNGEYKQLKGAENPFKDLEVEGYFSPSFGDIDGDGDLDMISGGDGYVQFFRNADGVYAHETETSPFAEIYVSYFSAANLVDIDADGDLDLFITNEIGEVFFYKNVGSAQIPEFSLQTGENNLLQMASGFVAWPISFLEFRDLDHDGDLDLIFNGNNQSQQPGEFLYFENTGTKEDPVFTDFFSNFVPGTDTGSLQAEFVDIDGDGDLDVLIGNKYGTLSLFKNENPTVAIEIVDTPLNYKSGDDPILIEPDLILYDKDNDFIIQATVNIENFLPGETLAFTSLGNISGVFDTSTGVLTLRGKGTVDEYQAVLRTVTFEVSYSSGRRSSGKNTLIGKSISFAVYDQDFTTPQVVSKSLEVFVNDPPAINTHTLNVIAGEAGTVDLKTLISDPNGAANLDLNTLKVIDQPASGAVTSIDANGILRVDYNAMNFTGTETMLIEVCDLDGACVQNTLTVIVVNTPPVVAPQSVTTLAGTTVTINLIDFTSDADGNLDPNSFSIAADPAHATSASIEVVSATEVNLIISYEGTTFYGSDELTIQACDLVGSCVQNTLAITVANTPPVIGPENVNAPAGVIKTINLMTITSDVDGNLNPEGFSVVSPPLSNAIATIVVVSPTVVNLLMDYDDIVFSGVDALTIRACDKAGACTESIIQIQVDVDAAHSVTVFNAIAPNSSGNNRFMRISGLPQENKVSIFNRWGDKVYNTESYSNDPSLNAFQGLSNNGNSLPSGAYFYMIEIPGRQAITGYLILKQ